MNKYVNVDSLCEKIHSAFQMSAVKTATEEDVLYCIRNSEAADVVPVSFIREWYEEHYGTISCPLINEWRGKK